jgi:hypothetical protein
MREFAITESEETDEYGSPYWAIREPIEVAGGRLWKVIDRRYSPTEAARIAREMCVASEQTKK